ncbi:hypothetical protein LCGC14_1496970 [marine sediment metagenome]|uniref:Glycosyltransferase family 25 (LPS biosynthesis protein) n=1 Tax=marine sediment metagenome TaxID=412755 RepID=A0A0F9J566_9ZZZZ
MKTYCINLDSRPRKWKRVQKEAAKVDIKLERFSGIKTDYGHIGCTNSHKAILDKAKGNGIFMIIEDDFKICVESPKAMLALAMSQLPDDWDMLYLGATLSKSLDIFSSNLYRLQGGLAAHAIIYNNQNGVIDYILKSQTGPILDKFYRDVVQKKFNCFITFPMMATQRAGRSDILNKRTSYKNIERFYKKHVTDHHYYIGHHPFRL